MQKLNQIGIAYRAACVERQEGMFGKAVNFTISSDSEKLRLPLIIPLLSASAVLF